VWRRAAKSLGIVAVLGEWSIVPMQHYSHTVAAYPHALQALTALPARTSYRPMMALTAGAMETCTCMLGTCVPSTVRPTRLLFMLQARGPQGAMGHMAAPEPASAERRGPEP
jgi:hypothetical protein